MTFRSLAIRCWILAGPITWHQILSASAGLWLLCAHIHVNYLCSICKSIDSWLKSDSRNVVVVHCKV